MNSQMTQKEFHPVNEPTPIQEGIERLVTNGLGYGDFDRRVARLKYYFDTGEFLPPETMKDVRFHLALMGADYDSSVSIISQLLTESGYKSPEDPYRIKPLKPSFNELLIEPGKNEKNPYRGIHEILPPFPRDERILRSPFGDDRTSKPRHEKNKD